MTTATTNRTPRPDEADRPLLVDVATAARTLAVSRSSIYKLIWNGQLTPVRIGRSLRFSIAQLERFVDDRIADERP